MVSSSSFKETRKILNRIFEINLLKSEFIKYVFMYFISAFPKYTLNEKEDIRNVLYEEFSYWGFVKGLIPEIERHFCENIDDLSLRVSELENILNLTVE